jgi:hypothetical protein
MRKRQLNGRLYIAMLGMAGYMPNSSAVFASASARDSYVKDENEEYPLDDDSNVNCFGDTICDWDFAEVTIAEVCHDNSIDLTGDVPAHVTTKSDFITWLYDNGYFE